MTEQLNDAQRRAVVEGDGSALVLAGAGSGKTRVVVERIAWLVGERGVDAWSILALTFTNRAAAEMRERVAGRLGRESVPAWVGTFHSFGLYVLRREMVHLGRPKTFTVFDEDDQLSVMKHLVRGLSDKWAKVSPRQALWWISRLKQDLETPNRSAPPKTPQEATYRELWSQYHAALEQVAAVDFDDLLVLTARLLEQHEEVRARYQRRYRYIHIDEYQDTNRAQYRIAKLLSEGEGNLFVVGDEDQAIYSWRGASIRNILEFERDFPKARVFRLEQNYRSSGAILAAANALVARNRERLGKTLWTAHEGGDPVRLYWAQDGADEARYVAEAIKGGKTPLRDAAVLFRTNSQSRLLEEAMRRAKIAYVVVGGIQFYARKEVRDLIAYLRLLVNPADDVSLRRIINVPHRGIGSATLERIEEYAAARATPLLQVLRDVEHDQTLPGRARNALADFVHLMDDLALAARNAGLAELVKKILEETRYEEYVRQTDEKDFRSRIEIVEEFVSACAQFEQAAGRAAANQEQTEQGGLQNFLQDLALMSDADNYDPNAQAVRLMTCHSAKGLEFDEVFLIGLEEGLLPHASASADPREVEEERRLCYVAMTRAKKRLTFCAAHERIVYGEQQKRDPSRFLNEIPRERLEVVGGDRGAPGARGDSPGRAAWKPGGQAVPPQPEAPSSSPGRLKMGTVVRHATFGRGVVLYTSGTGEKQRARIRFDTGRASVFVVSKAPLEILEEKKR